MPFVKTRAALFAGLVAAIFFAGGDRAVAADDKTASTLDAKAVEKIIRDYLQKNPKIVIDAIEAHRRNVAAEEERALRRTIAARRDELRNDPGSVVGGNPSGDVTVVEFFDYRCGVCKRVHPIVDEMVKRDGKIRRVYKEWPILGPESIFASRAAIASRKQGDDKYLDFHNRMMEARRALTADTVLALAQNSGLDIKRLSRDMNSAEVNEILRRNYALAEALKLDGTPSFLIGDTLLRGARDIDTMLNMVRAARKKS